MSDSYVQVAPDAGGKQIDSQTCTNGAGQTVYRQTITIGDPNVQNNILNIDASGLLQNSGQVDALRALVQSQLLAAQKSSLQYGAGNGFLPQETPTFLTGAE